MREDRNRWEGRYQATSAAVLPRGEPELVALANHLPGAGCALELASGNGANALYLATLGYRVVAVDIALSGLRQCQQAALARSLPVFPVAMDFDTAELPRAAFDLVSVVRYLNRDLFPAIIAALRPGGLMFYKTFNRNHLRTRPGFNPAYLLEQGELQQAFAELTTIAAGNADSSSWILARR